MSWQNIILHHSASVDHKWADTETFDRWHKKRGWRMIGYHKIIELLNEHYYSIMGRPLYLAGSHCRGWNSTSIGVVFAGNFEVEEMAAEQIEVGSQQIAELCLAYRIPIERIWLHRDCGNTQCPGKHFPHAEIITRVRKLVLDKEV